MKIEAFITEKLFQGEAVKVEGLGTFSTIEKSTSIHPGDQRFEPSCRMPEFTFNPETKDEGLAAFIAQKTSGGKNEILEEIRKRSATIRDELKAGRKVQLQNLGFLYYDFRGEVRLDADRELNFSKESYGLPSFHAKLVTSESKMPEEKKPEKKKAKISSKSSIKNTEQKTAQATLTDAAQKKATPTKTEKPKGKKERTKGKKESRKTAVWLVSLSVVLLVGAAAWYFRDDWQKWIEKPMTTTAKKEKEVLTDTVPDTLQKQDRKTAVADTLSNDTASKKVQPSADSNQHPADEAANTGKEDTDIPQADRGDYLIIAGCFESVENADEFVQELKKKGYKASIQGTTPHGLYRVVYGVYDKRSNAVNTLNSIRANENKGAWLDRY